EMLRLIREEEPLKPSARLMQLKESLATLAAQRQTEPARLTREVRGELDWIVMKCLEKDRPRRYDTVNGLARDVERYLHDEPVEACPPSASYRLRKFLHKHRGGVLMAAALVAALVLGVVVSTWQAVRATHAELEALVARDAETAQRQEAERQQHEMEQQRDRAAKAEDEAKQQRDRAVRAEAEGKQQRADAQRSADHAREAAQRATRALYAAQMNLAQIAWEESKTVRVQQLLGEWAAPVDGQDLRGWEWFYQERLQRGDLRTLKTDLQLWGVA